MWEGGVWERWDVGGEMWERWGVGEVGCGR